jgi:hypothetical protein
MSTEIRKVHDGFVVNSKHVIAYGTYIPPINLQSLSEAERNSLMSFIRSLQRVKIQSTIQNTPAL